MYPSEQSVLLVESESFYLKIACVRVRMPQNPAGKLNPTMDELIKLQSNSSSPALAKLVSYLINPPTHPRQDITPSNNTIVNRCHVLVEREMVTSKFSILPKLKTYYPTNLQDLPMHSKIFVPRQVVKPQKHQWCKPLGTYIRSL